MTFDPTSDLDPNTTYTANVGTTATDPSGNALMPAEPWSFTTAAVTTHTPAPNSVTRLTGTLRANGFAQLETADNFYYQVNSSKSGGTQTTAWFGSFTGVSNDLANLKVTYEGHSSRTTTQTIRIYNWGTSLWDLLDSRSVGNADVLIAELPAAPPSLERYVSGDPGIAGEVRIQIRATRGSNSFFASGDFLKIVYDAP